MASIAKIGKYEIKSRLGEGGAAIVFQAYDPVIQRTVALKAINKALLTPAERSFILDRFRREAQAAGRLVHPNIVAVFDFGEERDFAFMAMEYVSGETLDAYLAKHPSPDFSWVRELSAQLLDALDYAHTHGVVHRDVKPSNILVAKDGRIKVTDFGIARVESSQVTHAGEILGTPYYMAPEQFQGQPADHRSDLYSAGVIVYELVTGVRPFQGDTATIMQQAVQVMPPPPSELNLAVAKSMDAVLARALAKRPVDRYQSATEFAADLLRALGEFPSVDFDVLEGSASPRKPRLPEGLAGLARRAARSGTFRLSTDDSSVSSDDGSKLRVLFVDDEERILSALRSLFRSKYHVFTATDGEQALEFVRRFPIQVVVSDQRMPGMSGVELLREVRKESPETVRILLTGYSDLASIVGSINDGEVYQFVSKPWNNQELSDMLAEAAAIGAVMSESFGAKTTALKSNAAVLVIDDQQELYRAAREMMLSHCPVAFARSLEEALQVMREVDVAVILADIDAVGPEGISFLKVLKQQHPECLAIVVTTASDSEAIIDLINQAHIYRFLNKPVNLGLMRQHMLSALERYQAFLSSPTLLGPQKVEDSSKARQAATGLSEPVMQGLRSLRGRAGAESAP
jgi:serine/threonine-protein kinase